MSARSLRQVPEIPDLVLMLTRRFGDVNDPLYSCYGGGFQDSVANGSDRSRIIANLGGFEWVQPIMMMATHSNKGVSRR